MSDQPFTRPQSWRARELLHHAKLNQLVDGLNRLSAAPPIPESLIIPSATLEIMALGITAIQADYLECINAGEAAINVARPWLLRADTLSWNGFTYSKINAQTRVATLGADTETQVVVPAYVVGDIIWALNVQDGTGVEDALAWMDLNFDARAWAEQFEA